MFIDGVDVGLAFGPRSVRHSHGGQAHTHKVLGAGVLGPAKRCTDQLPRSFSMTFQVTHASTSEAD